MSKQDILYIFLDVDGVLNTKEEWRKIYSLNRKCIKNFAQAVKKCGNTRIVLSSSWRTGFAYARECEPHVKELQAELAKYGLEIYGKTPMDPLWTRTDEIQAYIESYDVKKYVIIDDDSALFVPGCKNLFLIDNRKGFTSSDGLDLCSWVRMDCPDIVKG